MRRRGVSHVEMVFAFILFAAAVGFALYFFSPLQTDRFIDTSLEYATREIMKNASFEMEVYHVWLDSSEISGDVLAVEIEEVDPALKCSVIDSGGTVLDSQRNIGDDLIFIDNVGSGWDDFIEIRFGEVFEEISVGSVVHDGSLYEISSSEVKEILVESRIAELSYKCDVDFFGLREDFNLPGRVYFGFSLDLGSDSIECDHETSGVSEIFSETQRVEVLRNDGRIEFGDLTVRVW